MSNTGLFLPLFAAFGMLACFPLWLLIRALRRGVWNAGGDDVLKKERPLTFWFGIMMYGFIAAVAFAFLVDVALDIFAPK